ncbi:hypothetical protein JTB14_001992 [Gonioctena quinquepunctata]|nr:hypothetical protein JTB14_001992 [Gonioctena quinquepunctata]
MFFLSSVMKSLLMILVLAVAVTTFVEMRGTDGDFTWPWHPPMFPPVPRRFIAGDEQPPVVPKRPVSLLP